jgi:WD40 repeat protein
MRVYDSSNAAQVACIPHAGPVIDLSLSGDGRFLASASYESIIRIFNTSNWDELFLLPSQKAGITTAISLSSDGHFLAAGYADNKFRMYDLVTRRELYAQTRNGPLITIAFMPDSRYVAVAGLDNVVHCFKTVDGTEARILASSDQALVRSVAFSPDGRYLAAISGKRTASVYDVATGYEVSRIMLASPAWKLAFDGTGTHLVVAAFAAFQLEFSSYLLRPSDMIDDLCSRLSRNLTAKEWAEYIGDEVPYRRTCQKLH